ncbi:protein jagunal homolog 1 [Aplysia californica]|uniref:Protein jagunal homolog 1 n=1 Tax=Aplysia californica TaxID=6500 RepID=A0ABM0JNA0_APLCA|nr:protein jagunal homolog 1 [Aplysia californica]
MASRGGHRPEGSDGSDHWHRESIAWQYKISSINKWRLRLALFLQIQLGLLMFVRLLPGIAGAFGFTVIRLRRLDLPHPRPWEYAWLVSLIAAVIGWRSTPTNNSFLLKQFVLGTIVFGLAPVFFGAFDLRNDIMLYLQEKKFTYEMFGFPAVLIWSVFMLIALQIHVFALYFSVVLLRAWRPRPSISGKLKAR